MKKLSSSNPLMVLCVLAALAGCSSHASHNLIEPLPAGFTLETMSDCTVPAKFSASDFNWRGSNLTMTVFSEDFYDAVEVSKMTAGDTLVFAGNKIVVETIEEENGILTINNGIEEGGAYLKADEGGTYKSLLMDDHSVYTEIGRKEIPLSEDFVIIDCGTEPNDTVDTIRTGQKPYIDSLESYKTEFIELNTRVRIEGGVIKEINRHWIP